MRPEIWPNPPEFGNSPRPAAPKKRNRKWLLAAALVLLAPLVLRLPAGTVPQVTEPPETVPVTQPPETLTPETLPPETLPPETEPPETEPPETEPPVTEPLVYENSGTLVLRVYNDSFEFGTGPDGSFFYREQMLLETEMPEAEFEDLTLPEPIEQEGFRALGYVICNNAAQDYSAWVGPVLTAEDFAPVPPVDGVRTVDVHVVWEPEDDSQEQFLILDGVPVCATRPLASEGWIYLKQFGDHWYNSEGKEVFSIEFLEFYPMVDGEYDWFHNVTVELSSTP